jgi:hypothetical protein
MIAESSPNQAIERDQFSMDTHEGVRVEHDFVAPSNFP